MPPPVHAVDWPALIADVCGGRMSEVRAASELKVPRMTLRGWLNGSQPGHAEGERVILLWMRLTGKPREALPMERRPLAARYRG